MSRYRNLAVLVIVIAAQLVLLAYQVRTKEDVSLLRSATVTAVSPLAKALDNARGSSLGFLDRYILLLRVEQENERLKTELDKMKLENQFLRTELTTADRVRALAMFQQQTRAKTVAARIIGTGTGANSKAVFVDRGMKDGVERGMAVITPDGIVGKVTFVYPAASQVLLITDPFFAAGVISQKSRVPGTLKGLGRSQVLVDHIQNEIKVEEGEWFFTSGDDRVFAKGLPAGQVRTVRQGKEFKEIFLDPSGLQRGLEEVLIVLEGVHQAIPEGTGPAAGPVSFILPPPESAETRVAEQKALESGIPALSTDADRLREKIKRIGEIQGVRFGNAGARLPNFNMDPNQVTRPQASVLAPPPRPAEGQAPAPAPATATPATPTNPPQQ
ncbi:MAG TPA: rod shape-determining protein MreC [Bryobacteraceae bacterium]|nr:rod shape-determining protein MreC [Bryobacteraceae bacterium]